MPWTLQHSATAGKWAGIATVMGGFAFMAWIAWPSPLALLLIGGISGWALRRMIVEA